jgi:hypothetical protein
MGQNNTNTETVEQFLARGGEVKHLPIKGYSRWKKQRVAKVEEEPQDEEIDYSALPTALKIKYGVKE